jgi:hypothetical protein
MYAFTAPCSCADVQEISRECRWGLVRKDLLHRVNLRCGFPEPAILGASDQWQKAIQFVKEQRVGFAPIRQKLVALVELQPDKKLLDRLSKEERHFCPK